MTQFGVMSTIDLVHPMSQTDCIALLNLSRWEFLLWIEFEAHRARWDNDDVVWMASESEIRSTVSLVNFSLCLDFPVPRRSPQVDASLVHNSLAWVKCLFNFLLLKLCCGRDNNEQKKRYFHFLCKPTRPRPIRQTLINSNISQSQGSLLVKILARSHEMETENMLCAELDLEMNIFPSCLTSTDEKWHSRGLVTSSTRCGKWKCTGETAKSNWNLIWGRYAFFKSTS